MYFWLNSFYFCRLVQLKRLPSYEILFWVYFNMHQQHFLCFAYQHLRTGCTVEPLPSLLARPDPEPSEFQCTWPVHYTVGKGKCKLGWFFSWRNLCLFNGRRRRFCATPGDALRLPGAVSLLGNPIRLPFADTVALRFRALSGQRSELFFVYV